jgi:hypothetical protein
MGVAALSALMRHILLLAAAPLLAVFPSQLQAAPRGPAVTAEAMMRHIEVLASDEFEGRKPGTAGETKTLQYVANQLAALGLEGAAGNGGWYQPVPLVNSRAFAHRVLFTADSGPIAFDQDDIVLSGTKPLQRLADAPLWFVGVGAADNIAGADLGGAVALMTIDARSSLDYEARAAALRSAGAAAVIAVLGEETSWPAIRNAFRGGRDQLQRNDLPEIQGAMPFAAASRLIDGARLASGAQAGFRAVQLPVRATFDVSTQVHRYDSHNLIARLRGKGNKGESVLYLAHWDHLGICRPEGAADRICNGAVDNASGLAMMIEIARHMARRERPSRDILFMGTTAEEMGLLGAKYFGANPTVPLKSIVAAINIDTVAIAPAGEPVAIVGRGTTPLDPLVDATARELGRAVDLDEEASAFVQRQDGWELTKASVPTVMVGGAFSNMARLQAFLGGPYHKPEDGLDRPIELGGAAEDTELMIALGRKLADPKRYQPAAANN